MPFEIIRNDITRLKVDAIVNAANSALKMGGGVCGAIFRAAGAKELQDECNSIGGCNVGEAVITKGYKLPAKYIIHTVGPIWKGGNNNEEQHLKSCYINSLKLAQKYKLESIAFPLISSGIYGYPKSEALRVAMDAVKEFLLYNEMMIYLVIFDIDAFKISEKIFQSIKSYIDENYISKHLMLEESRVIEEYEYENIKYNEIIIIDKKRSLEDVVSQLQETFSEMLLRLIDEKGKTDVEIYKRANIDRKLFSKIRGDKFYKPRKSTVLAFAIALELNIDETNDLLNKAGYTLSHSFIFDIIVEYFIKEGIYNIFEINEALFAFEQPLLGV